MRLILEELLEWSRLLRNNLDKLLLFVAVIGMVALVLHMSHDKMDEDHVSWAREVTGTILGGFMGIITGRSMAKTESRNGHASPPHDVTESK